MAQRLIHATLSMAGLCLAPAAGAAAAQGGPPGSSFQGCPTGPEMPVTPAGSAPGWR